MLVANRFTKNSIKIIFYFTYIVVVLLLTFRPDTIPDYISYNDIFNKVNRSLLGTNFLAKDYTVGVEYGFIFLIYIFKLIFGNNFRLFLFFLTSITIIVTVWYMEKIVNQMSAYSVKDRWINRYIILGLFYSHFGLQYQGIAIRTALSFCFFIIALYMVIGKKYITSLLWLVIGFTVHRMTVIGFGIIFLYILIPHIRKKHIKIFGYIVFISIITVYVTGRVSWILKIANQVENYIFSFINYSNYIVGIRENGNLGNNGIYLLIVIFSAFIMYKEGKIMGILLGLLGIGGITILATVNISGASRIYDYFILLICPVLVECVCKRNRRIIYLLYLCLIICLNSIVSFRIWGVM